MGEKTELGNLTLDHVDRYRDMLIEAGVETDETAPILLPNYRGEKSLLHRLEIL